MIKEISVEKLRKYEAEWKRYTQQQKDAIRGKKGESKEVSTNEEKSPKTGDNSVTRDCLKCLWEMQCDWNKDDDCNFREDKVNDQG